MEKFIAASALALVLAAAPAAADDRLRSDVAADYEANLAALFTHFHLNPELSHRE